MQHSYSKDGVIDITEGERERSKADTAAAAIDMFQLGSLVAAPCDSLVSTSICLSVCQIKRAISYRTVPAVPLLML